MECIAANGSEYQREYMLCPIVAQLWKRAMDAFMDEFQLFCLNTPVPSSPCPFARSVISKWAIIITYPNLMAIAFSGQRTTFTANALWRLSIAGDL